MAGEKKERFAEMSVSGEWWRLVSNLVPKCADGRTSGQIAKETDPATKKPGALRRISGGGDEKNDFFVSGQPAQRSFFLLTTKLNNGKKVGTRDRERAIE